MERFDEKTLHRGRTTLSDGQWGWTCSCGVWRSGFRNSHLADRDWDRHVRETTSAVEGDARRASDPPQLWSD